MMLYVAKGFFCFAAASLITKLMAAFVSPLIPVPAFAIALTLFALLP